MKKLLLIIFICISGFSFGKGVFSVLPEKEPWIQQNAQCTFPVGVIKGNTMAELGENASYYLKNTVSDLKNTNVDLILLHSIQSPYAKYFDFLESLSGYEVYGTTIRIGIDKNNNIISIVSKTVSFQNAIGNVKIPDFNKNNLEAAIGKCDNYKAKPVWFYDGNNPIPAFDVICNNENGSRSEDIVLNTNYEILYRNNLLKNYKYPDSLATMYVFYPDPLTSAKVPYGEPYTNHNDSNVAALDSQMVPKITRVSVLNDSFFLENEFVKEANLGGQVTIPTYSKNGIFHFHRDTNAFRDIMIYYHLNNWRAHLKDLGYDSLGHIQIVVDAQAMTEDQSNFSHTGNNPYLYFGTGGIPDAEDADVPYHEYTHFLSFSACPGCSEFGWERGALDEGTGDYFAASFSKAMSTYNWEKVYNWDGNNFAPPPWTGRSCAIPDHYPIQSKLNDQHAAGQLWSSSLMQIWDSIGRTKTDIVMLETLYSLGKNLNMTDAAKLYIKTDSLIFKGADARVMAHYFIKRGFLSESYMGILPINQQVGYKIITYYFSSANKVIFDFDEPQTGNITIYNITGKEIISKNLSNASQYEFTSPEVEKGIYILSVNTNGLYKSFKVLK